jgi:hypothetical protein
MLVGGCAVGAAHVSEHGWQRCVAGTQTRDYVESHLGGEIRFGGQTTGHGGCGDRVVVTRMLVCEDDVRGRPPLDAGDHSLSNEASHRTKASLQAPSTLWTRNILQRRHSNKSAVYDFSTRITAAKL